MSRTVRIQLASTLIAIASLVTPLAAAAQIEYPLYCDLLDDTDCTFLLQTAETMGRLQSGANRVEFHFEASRIPDLPFEALTLDVTQSTSFHLTDEANQQRLALYALLQEHDTSQAAIEEILPLYANLLLGAGFDSETTVTLSEDALALIRLAAENEGDPLPFELPATMTVRLRLADGTIYLNISDLAAVLPGLKSVGDIWFGVEFRSLLELLLERSDTLEEFMPLNPDELAEMSPLLAASGSVTAGPIATMLTSTPVSAELAPFLLVERQPNATVDGTEFVVFRTTVDYALLLEDPRIQELLVGFMFEQAIVGPNATPEEIDDMLFLATSFGPQLFDTLGLEAIEQIDPATGYLHQSQLQLNWDIAQIAPLLEMTGDDTLASMDALPILSLTTRTDYRDHDQAPSVAPPEISLILATEELIDLIKAELDRAVARQAATTTAPEAKQIVAGNLTSAAADAAVLLQDARRLMEAGDYQDAIVLLDQAVALEPENPDYLTERARALFLLDQFEAALIDFEAALAIAPSAVALNGRGASHRQLGDLARGIADFEAAIALDSSYPQAAYNLALAFARQGDYARAIALYDQAIEVDPNYVEAFKERGLAYYELEEYENALRDFDHAIEMAPDYAAAYIDRGNVYLRYEDYAAAEADYTRSIELDPTGAIAYNNRGWSHYLQAQDEQALADYTVALELAPSYVTARYNRGEVYRILGQYELAILDYDAILEIDPDSGWAYYDRGLSYYDLGDYARAIADLDAYIEFDPESAAAYFYRGYSFYTQGNFEQEVADYTRAIELDPDYTLAYYFRALTYISLKDFAAGLDDLNEALRLEPENIDYLTERGLLYLEVGEIPLGIADFDHIIELAPENARGYINRSYAHHLAGAYELALEDADRAVELDPEDPIAWGNRADADARLENTDAAFADYEATFALDPDYALAYRSRGDLYSELQRTTEAIADYTRYLELAPEAEDRDEIEAKLAALQ